MKFLVTAGPTREPLDPVRYISNRSSGKMGYAIAEAAADAGHEIILISGPVNLAAPPDVKLISVFTSDEMFDAVYVYAHADECDVCVLCAAVADYKPAKVSPIKIKKSAEKFFLELTPTRDILDSLGHRDARKFLLVGFAAETNDAEENAAKKLREKNCDIIIMNDVSSANSGIESDVNEVIVLFQNGQRQRISRAPKRIIARELVKIFADSATKMFDKKNVMISERNEVKSFPTLHHVRTLRMERGEVVMAAKRKPAKKKAAKKKRH